MARWSARGGNESAASPSLIASQLSTRNGFQIDPLMKDSDLERELELLALSEAPSGRARLAKVAAIRALQRLRRPPDPDPVDDSGRFHPGPSQWWELDASDPDEVREAWRERTSR
jgi:hypothetical protein